jgi:hypothetical protein
MAPAAGAQRGGRPGVATLSASTRAGCVLSQPHGLARSIIVGRSHCSRVSLRDSSDDDPIDNTVDARATRTGLRDRGEGEA